jgi:uncharacterized protein YecT (DUF1311 family)
LNIPTTQREWMPLNANKPASTFDSYRRLAGALFLAVGLAALSLPALAQPAGAANWALAYEGKSTNQFVGDKRANRLMRASLPAKLSDHVLESLGGPPDPVFMTDHRYVSVSACRPHSCMEKGWFWLDTKTGTGLGAYFVEGALQLASSSLPADRLPPPARRALLGWLADNDLRPQTVEFFGAAGPVTPLPLAQFAPPARFVPPEGGPSFDCAAAATRIEKTICADTGLAKQDLELAQLVTELRHGHSTTGARDQLLQLQRKWLAERNASCERAPEAAACLRERYRFQHDRLMNWIPTT